MYGWAGYLKSPATILGHRTDIRDSTRQPFQDRATLATLDDINTVDVDGRTSLHRAAADGQLAIVRALIGLGKNTNARDNKGLTPVHIAAGMGHVKIIRLLIQKDANCDAQDKWGKTPLHHAAIKGQTEAVRELIRLGVNLNILVQPSSNIRTASHLQWSAFVSPLKRLGHFLIEEVYKLMKPCFKVFC